MEVAEALAFARTHHRGVLATTRADGHAALTPVVAGVDGDDRLVVSTRETAYKVHHVRRVPYAACCLFPDDFFGAWVQLEGPVEIVPLPAALDGLVALYRQVAGEHPSWDDFRAAMVSERRVLFRIAPTRVGPAVAG